MTRLSAKVCIIGDFAVGKTSTVERFVNNQFSEKYLTTIGVKVDTKQVQLADGIDLKLVIWDVAGTDRFGDLELSYLRGAFGYLLVADGTRKETIASARNLKAQVADRHGDIPMVFLLNKVDIDESWEVSESDLATLKEEMSELYVTSARTGVHVDSAIKRLGELIVSREFTD